MLLLAHSANHDERRYDDPDRFDIHREAGQHLTFGHGIHFCLGAALARLEGRIVVEEVLKRFPEWEVDLAGARMAPVSGVRGWETLPVLLSRCAAPARSTEPRWDSWTHAVGAGPPEAGNSRE